MGIELNMVFIFSNMKIFLNSCRFTGGCKETYRKLPCTFLPTSPDVTPYTAVVQNQNPRCDSSHSCSTTATPGNQVLLLHYRFSPTRVLTRGPSLPGAPSAPAVPGSPCQTKASVSRWEVSSVGTCPERSHCKAGWVSIRRPGSSNTSLAVKG